jgi:hypothetical protein
MSLTKRTDRAAQAQALLPQQFKDQVKLNAMIGIVAGSSGSQGLEDAAFEVRDECDIDGGSGVQLDLEGETVGQERISAVDQEYRDALWTKVAINTSQGSPDELTNVAQRITGASAVHFFRYGMAHCCINCIGVTHGSELARLVKVVPAEGSLEVNAGTTSTPFILGRGVDAAGILDSTMPPHPFGGLGFGNVDPGTGIASGGGEFIATYVEAGT